MLVLRDVEGLSYDEVAAITKTPLGSVKGRLHRARRELIGLLRANTYDWSCRMSDEPLEPEERRSAALLAEVARVQVHVEDRFVPGVVRRARAQRAVATPLRAVGLLLAAIGGALIHEARRARR